VQGLGREMGQIEETEGLRIRLRVTPQKPRMVFAPYPSKGLAYQQTEKEANEPEHGPNCDSYTATCSIATLCSIDLESSPSSSLSLWMCEAETNLCGTEIIFLRPLS
jgi:hypothetical protein